MGLAGGLLERAGGVDEAGAGMHNLAAALFGVSAREMARIVTLNNINLQLQEKSGQLSLEAVAKTFRYLDAGEIAAGRREAAKARPGAGGKGPTK